MNKQYSKEWFEKAEKDLKTAKYLFTKKDTDFFENIAFLCQQFVEKYLKGFLAFHNKPIDKTHIIEKLLWHCNKIDDFSSVKNVAGLSIFAVNRRYPGDNTILTKEEIDEIIQQCKQVKKLIQEFLSKDRLI